MVLLVAAAVIVADSCSQIDTLTIQLPRPSQPEFAGFVVPSLDITGAPKFSDECLRVIVQGGGNNFNPIEELAERADVALAEGSWAAKLIQSGFQLKIIAGYYQKEGLVWVGFKKLASLQELAFKKVGMWKYGYSYPLEALLSKQTPPVPFTTVDQDPISMEQLETGTIDLASAMIYDNLGRPLQKVLTTTDFPRQLSDLHILDPAKHGFTDVHNVLLVRPAKLATHRARIVRFLKVVTKTWLFCRDNEAACASAFSEYSTVPPQYQWQMREVNKFIFPSPIGHGLGVTSHDRWNAMNAWMVSGGLLTSAISSSVIDNSLVLEAGALKDISVWRPISSGSLEFCANYGSGDAGLRICQGFESQHCPAGMEPVNETACQKCGIGRYTPAAQRMNTCKVCPSGRSSTTVGASECALCPSGRFWENSGGQNVTMAECKSCPAGRYTNAVGASQCRSCEKGFFTDKMGSMECLRCPRGKYMDTAGGVQCTPCKEGMDTLMMASISLSVCVCPEGTYEALDGHTCIGCPLGMSCATNSKLDILLGIANGSISTQAPSPAVTVANTSNASTPPVSAAPNATVLGNFPLLRPGYWSANVDPMFIYLCKHTRSCPGKYPNQCAHNSQGVACSQCQAGYYQDGEQCLECTGMDESAFNYPIIQLIFGPPVILILYFAMRDAREEWGSWWNEICNIVFIGFAFYQITGLIQLTFVEYPDALASILTQFSYVVDIAGILRLDCSKYAEFHYELVIKETFPVFMMVLFVLVFVVCTLVYKLAAPCGYAEAKEQKLEMETVGACFPQMLRVCPMKVDHMVNLYFAIFHTFYLAIAFISLELFMCYQHPNKKYSLYFASEVICYDTDEWKGMLTEGVLDILLYIVFPFIGFSYIILMAPVRFHQFSFRSRWKFLFIKFKPDCYWWSVFHMLRSLLLCIILVLTQESARQVYLMGTLNLAYGILLVIRFPWRHRTANLFDLLVTCALLFFYTMSASFNRRVPWLDDQIAELAVTLTFSPFVVVFCLVLWVGWRASKNQANKTKKMKSELAENCRKVFARFVGHEKAEEKAELQAFVRQLPQQDRDVLYAAAAVIVAELLGHQPGSFAFERFPWRLVHKEQKLGARKWMPNNVAADSADADAVNAVTPKS
jgi:ABC-type nitrate/sulfonate/bicarbonate transport system substrate-binding protein